MPRRVLFLCTHNSARSQIAEALLRHLAGQRFEAHSAGTRPSQLDPLATAVMREIGIDMSGQRSKDVRDYAQQSIDCVITVCDQAREECPVFPATRLQLHWSVPDPAAVEDGEASRLTAFRRIRDDLSARIREFIAGAEP